MRLAGFGAVFAVLLATAALAQDAGKTPQPVVVTSVLNATVTATGQKIALPQGDARVSVTLYDIAAHATLPEHKHPFPRYAYVLRGTLRVTNTETGQSHVYKTGDFIIEAIGQWHKAEGVDGHPVKLLVIDQVAGDQVAGDGNNVVLRK
jgi:quercetin dioxygenase-like cupin family protein